MSILFASSDSDTDDGDDEMLQVDSTSISPSTVKRHVSFQPKKKSAINGKSATPTSPTGLTGSSVSPGVKMRQRRLRTTSRSGDERISFRGRNPIYTAGIDRKNQLNFLLSNSKVDRLGIM